MSETEFIVLDELYFIQVFDQLESSCDLSTEELLNTLKSLYSKGWIRILKSVDRDEDEEKVDLDINFTKYYYLASKEGLFAHNSR